MSWVNDRPECWFGVDDTGRWGSSIFYFVNRWIFRWIFNPHRKLVNVRVQREVRHIASSHVQQRCRYESFQIESAALLHKQPAAAVSSTWAGPIASSAADRSLRREFGELRTFEEATFVGQNRDFDLLGNILVILRRVLALTPAADVTFAGSQLSGRQTNRADEFRVRRFVVHRERRDVRVVFLVEWIPVGMDENLRRRSRQRSGLEQVVQIVSAEQQQNVSR